ncbi:hypothetical protein B0H15DRAFT_1023364 [Mycena belliarum]|uniref:Uncharacterized protein n=1 Tax=Mycena belliarum TaxID=1033014 RepID=A0AAD6U1L7_9AGAR|nr:hypothetical protein B0H15DRAFT_1023364 [Mycena belliae]
MSPASLKFIFGFAIGVLSAVGWSLGQDVLSNRFAFLVALATGRLDAFMSVPLHANTILLVSLVLNFGVLNAVVLIPRLRAAAASLFIKVNARRVDQAKVGSRAIENEQDTASPDGNTTGLNTIPLPGSFDQDRNALTLKDLFCLGPCACAGLFVVLWHALVIALRSSFSLLLRDDNTGSDHAVVDKGEPKYTAQAQFLPEIHRNFVPAPALSAENGSCKPVLNPSVPAFVPGTHNLPSAVVTPAPATPIETSAPIPLLPNTFGPALDPTATAAVLGVDAIRVRLSANMRARLTASLRARALRQPAAPAPAPQRTPLAPIPQARLQVVAPMASALPVKKPMAPPSVLWAPGGCHVHIVPPSGSSSIVFGSQQDTIRIV